MEHFAKNNDVEGLKKDIEAESREDRINLTDEEFSQMLIKGLKEKATNLELRDCSSREDVRNALGQVFKIHFDIGQLWHSLAYHLVRINLKQTETG